MVFDVIFSVQHYYLYPQRGEGGDDITVGTNGVSEEVEDQVPLMWGASGSSGISNKDPITP